MRTGKQVVAYANTVHHWTPGHCLQCVQDYYPVAPTKPSAIAAWNSAQHRHGPTFAPPAGVPGFLSGGPYGHIVLMMGGWICRSTDYPYSGVVNNVDVRTLAKQWGMHYLGWTEDLEGTRIWTPPKPAPAPKPIPAGARVKPLLSTTKMNKTGPQVPDLRYVLIHAGFLNKAYASGTIYDIHVQGAVKNFHASAEGKRYASNPYGQIGPKGWEFIQRKIGRV